MYIKCGTKNRERFVDVKRVVAAVGHDICSALPGIHYFTRCDIVVLLEEKVREVL